MRRLARAAGVECVHPRPYVRTTLPDAQAREGLADLVDRDFRPPAADQLWVGDITYIHTFSGFAYLATVIDLFSNKVVGWMVADHMRTGLVLDALDMALAARRPGIGEAVMHTDRGAQYTSHAFRDRCLANGVIPSALAARGPAMTMRQRNHLTPRSEEAAHPPASMAGCRRGTVRGIRLHRAVLQPRPETAPPGENESCAV